MAPATSDDPEESAAADAPDGEDDAPETEDDATDGAADDPAAEGDTAHLDDLPDGSGCAEVWEHLSEEDEAADGDGGGDSDDGDGA